MRLKDFNDYRIINIKGQVVKKKSPWPKILVSALVTSLIIFVFTYVKPNFVNGKIFSENIGKFFDFSKYKDGLSETTISDTLLDSISLLWSTILYSLLGTVIGVFISVPLALVSSKNIVKKWYIYAPFRFLMSLIRSIPPLVVAFLMFNIFSNTLSAAVAISIFVTSIMTKWLFEELDSIDLSAFTSLNSLGNQKNRSITKAVFPYLIKSVFSYGIYAFEMVIRFAAILGFCGIATIGILFEKTKTIDRFGHMSIVLWTLIITIIIIEILTMLFKKYILNRQIKQATISKSKNIDYQIAQVRNQKSKMWITNSIIGVVFSSLLIVAVLNVEWSLSNQDKLDTFKTGIKSLMHPEWKFIREFDGVNAITLGLKALVVSIAGAIIGFVLSLIFGILASKAFLGKYFSWIFKITIIIIRSIPVFVYAILFVFLAPEDHYIFAGVLALGIHSIGMLGKLTYEKIDSIDISSRDALEVMGANRILSTKWVLLQEALPTILSNAIYRIEINFKSMVQIGIVGASVFGGLISIYSGDPKNFSSLTPYLLVTMIIILILEQISNLLRKKIMTGQFVSKNNLFIRKYRKLITINALANANTFNLDFINNAEKIKFNNHVGRKMKQSKENKLAYKETKQKINEELKKSSFNAMMLKYENQK